MSMKKVKLLLITLTLLPIFLLILGYVFPSYFFSNQDSIREFVTSFGVYAPLIFILIQISQVIITPFSHYAVSIAGGYIFGTWYGFLYNWIGRVIGTAIAFYLGRFFGRKILKRVVKKKTLEKYDFMFQKGAMLLFLAYFLPVFPDDELSYLAGISSLSKKTFLILMSIGHVSGSLSLAYLGNGIKSITAPMFIILSLLTLIGGILFAFQYSRKIKHKINNSSKSL